MAEKFEAQLTVDKNIVSLLSRSTYQRNFSYALRELVSNSYDADATTVEIDYDDEKKELSVSDNGNGMTSDEFQFYLRIAGQKRGKRKTSRFGRKRIGQFGVGFLSVLPFCEILRITTTTENSPDILSADIPADDFFSISSQDSEVGDVKVKGYILDNPEKAKKHFTKIQLVGLTEQAIARLSEGSGDDKADSITKWSPHARLIWELQDELPLAYPKGSPLNDVLSYPEPIGMEVHFQGRQLFRNIPEGEILDSGGFEVGGIKGRYAIITPWKPVKPLEMRRMKLRLNNVGVGKRREFGIEVGRRYSRLMWLSGEAQILSGLDESININREDFINSPEFESLSVKLAGFLRKQADSVEFIDVTAKDLSRQLRGSKQARVASKKEVVEKNIKKLVEKGFTVRKVLAAQIEKKEPISVNRKTKEILMAEGHPGLEDRIKLSGRSYQIEYEDLDATKETKGLPCLLAANNRIVINTNFPLFRSKRYGDVFKKVCIITAVAKERCKTPEKMFDYIMEEISNQFTDY